MSNSMSCTVSHDSGSRRFTADIDGHRGYVEYQRDGDTLALTHTIVPTAIGGRGVAAELVRAALEHARAEGLKVRPDCSYVESYLRRHDEYADLRAAQ